MSDQDQTREQLIEELERLRQRVAELETADQQGTAQRKHTAVGLPGSEQTLRTLIDASPESMLLIDTEGIVLFGNETVAHRLGTTVGDLVGRIVYDLFPPEVAANRRRHIEEVVRTGRPMRFEDRRFDRHVENALHPILNEQGKVVAIAGPELTLG